MLSFTGETCPREGTGENEAASPPILPEISLPFLTTRSVNKASLNHTVLQRGWPNKQPISPSTLHFNKLPGCEAVLAQKEFKNGVYQCNLRLLSLFFPDEHIRIFSAAGRWVTQPDDRLNQRPRCLQGRCLWSAANKEGRFHIKKH